MRERFLLKQRIRNPIEFQRVYAERKRFADRYYALCFRKNDEGYAKLGVVASKRNVRLAVARNRVKRSAREAFRKQKGLASYAYDIILVAKPAAATASREELRACLKRLFERLMEHYKN